MTFDFTKLRGTQKELLAVFPDGEFAWVMNERTRDEFVEQGILELNKYNTWPIIIDVDLPDEVIEISMKRVEDFTIPEDWITTQ